MCSKALKYIIGPREAGVEPVSINHSCDLDTYFTNSRVGKSRICVTATLRDIKAGEEITADYGDAYFLYMKKLECRFPTPKHAPRDKECVFC